MNIVDPHGITTAEWPLLSVDDTTEEGQASRFELLAGKGPKVQNERGMPRMDHPDWSFVTPCVVFFPWP